ncbi:MAG: glycoside hydrolase family 3 N-terminal domain-containing protein [Candidatus Izemoplasmataceae bacterium]
MDKQEFLDKLLESMTLEEKIGQLYQAPYFSNVVTGHAFDSSDTIKDIKEGKVGSVLSVHDSKTLRALQDAAKSSRLKIPLLFCFDVIHGYKTAFPINLALSNTFDPALIKEVSEMIAYETSHAGLHLTFSPMVDLVRDPRWGRVMESNGEDPYLSSMLAKAYVEGYQQNDLTSPNTVAACVKHFAGYGFSEAGREYNSVDISKRTFYQMVLPPFEAAINANVSMVMSSFNVLFDVPATANKFLLKDVLRDELSFDGVLISDYTSTEEIIQHKIAKDLKEVAFKCFDAGLEHEMVSKSFKDHLGALVLEGKIKEEAINLAVMRMLTLKYDLGLFDNPYSYFYDDESAYMQTEAVRKKSLEAAEKSMVLLKNDQALPLKKSEKVALIGPFLDSKDIIGEWAALCEIKDTVSVLDAFKKGTQPFKVFSDDSIYETSFEGIDKIVLVLGENAHHAGEGNSKTNLYLDDSQMALFDALKEKNIPVVVVIFAGRPLILSSLDKEADAILYAYQGSHYSGQAIYNLLTGSSIPSGKITMSFPYHEGQIPVYYNHLNTGRPFDPSRPKYRYNTRYIDAPNAPLYSFGHGLSYAKFIYENVKLDKESLTQNETLRVSVDVTNDSPYEADEIIQVYIEALSFSVSRPVNELKAFKRVSFKANETKQVTFSLTLNDFRYYNIDMIFTAEDHDYLVKVGPSLNALTVKKVHIKE